MEQFASYISRAHAFKHAHQFKVIDDNSVSILLQQHNTCDDWSQFYIITSQTFILASTLQCIRGCNFSGSVYLLGFNDTNAVTSYTGVAVKSGLHSSRFSGECILGLNCCVSQSECQNCYIDERAVVTHCPAIVGKIGAHYGNNEVINVGCENGGRQVRISIGSTFQNICASSLHKATPAVTIPAGTEAFYLTIIGKHASVFKCDVLINCVIGDECEVAMSSMESCSIWLNSKVKRAVLTKCLLDSGCKAVDCIAECTLAMDQASIGEKARVSNSIIGPDASVAGGECLHSVLGPFVGFHHQSLLIATIWPMGRGNIAYGAKVGANHTGRLNDQECFPGEGCFFGLGSSVKFPFNALESPYSIIAPSTVCLPQKISFPFSLISAQDQPVAGVSSSLCCIKPAWVLIHNPYLLDRSAAKFKQRGKAKFHNTGYSVLRPSTVELMRNAKLRLEVVGDAIQPFYLDADVPGLGKCILMERDRVKAIAAYTAYCRRYACTSLLEILEEKHAVPSTSGGLSAFQSPLLRLEEDLKLFELETLPAHRYGLALLLEEYAALSLDPNNMLAWPIASLLGELLELEQMHADGVAHCRAKDERGADIIEDYLQVHTAARDDACVQSAITTLTTLRERVGIVLTSLV